MEITARIRATVHKLHVNLGHPQTDQFIKVLRAARSKPKFSSLFETTLSATPARPSVGRLRDV
eukprot:5357435-Pyramimonas_sp.AAC.1